MEHRALILTLQKIRNNSKRKHWIYSSIPIQQTTKSNVKVIIYCLVSSEHIYMYYLFSITIGYSPHQKK